VSLRLPARAVQVVAGHTQARKWVQIEGLDAAGVRARLGVV